MELPQYQCHKVVRAAKITGWLGNEGDGYDITGEDHTVVAHVAANWIDKHNPSIGGYYVLYEDGNASYSPAKAFEDGYTKMEILQPPAMAPTSGPPKPAFDPAEVFTYHAPKGDQQHRYEVLRCKARELADMMLLMTPASAEQTLALRDLQRCVMMANAAIAINEA